MFIGEISLNKTWPRNKYLENNNTNNNKKNDLYYSNPRFVYWYVILVL